MDHIQSFVQLSRKWEMQSFDEIRKVTQSDTENCGLFFGLREPTSGAHITRNLSPSIVNGGFVETTYIVSEKYQTERDLKDPVTAKETYNLILKNKWKVYWWPTWTPVGCAVQGLSFLEKVFRFHGVLDSYQFLRIKLADEFRNLAR